jgi:type IV secretory pathway VirJ component
MSSSRPFRWPSSRIAAAALACLALVCGVAQAASRPSALYLPPAAPRPDAPVVIFYSGDGGWAALDRAVSRDLAAEGLPVVGVDSLHYFLKGRSAVAAATDLHALIARYASGGVVLAGYSFGAAALPLILQQLPQDDLEKIRLVALLAPPRDGALALRPWSWLDLPGPGDRRIAPVVANLKTPVLCLKGVGDRASDCAGLNTPTIEIGRGHHFARRYDAVAGAIGAALLPQPAHSRESGNPGFF